jgi:hypothetical protein
VVDGDALDLAGLTDRIRQVWQDGTLRIDNTVDRAVVTAG